MILLLFSNLATDILRLDLSLQQLYLVCSGNNAHTLSSKTTDIVHLLALRCLGEKPEMCVVIFPLMGHHLLCGQMDGQQLACNISRKQKVDQ